MVSELIESICLNLEPGQYHLGEHQLLMQMKNPQKRAKINYSSPTRWLPNPDRWCDLCCLRFPLWISMSFPALL